MTPELQITPGPQLAVCDQVHALKYRGEGETFREAMNRIASTLADGDAHYRAFRQLLLDQRFLPAGRVQSAIGAAKQVTPFNCFVSGAISDSLTKGQGNIVQRLGEAMETMRLGGGIGYDFSSLRPEGDMIRSLQSHSSGPISFMRIFNEACLAICSSGHRRGAQMGVLRVDHPDIETFIRAKQNTTALTGFNISVAITDTFMAAVETDSMFDLKFGERVYRQVRARTLWEMIMRSTWDWAEPGVLFIDRINQDNNLSYCETIAATNPCGEQPLPPHGACLLGSFNLVKYIRQVAGAWTFDTATFAADIPTVVRAMDNIIDQATYPLEEQKWEAQAKRRMGLGVTGLANALEALGLPYGTPAFLTRQSDILTVLRDEAYRASAGLAVEKGAFPAFEAAPYLEGALAQRLPDDIRQSIAETGLRNSHLTSIAPTGTISFTADNVSSGVEPVFAYTTSRPLNTPEGSIDVTVEDYGLRVFGVRGKTHDQVTAEEHVAVLTTAQAFMDSAVSKTCNVAGDMAWQAFKDIYMSAWKGGAKGCTTFNQDGKRMALLTAGTQEPAATSSTECFFDPDTGQRECA